MTTEKNGTTKHPPRNPQTSVLVYFIPVLGVLVTDLTLSQTD